MTRKPPKAAFCFVVIVLGLFLNVHSCKTNPDSLLYLFNKSEADSEKVEVLNELAWYYMTQKPDSALFFAKQAEAIALKIGNKKELATSLYRIGEIERTMGKYEQAISSINKSLALEKELCDLYGMAKTHGVLTILYRNIGEISKALKAGNTSIQLYKKLDRQQALANAYDRIAMLYIQQEKLDTALNYIYCGLKIRQKTKDSANMVFSYMHLAEAALLLTNYEDALEYNLMAKMLAERHKNLVLLAKIHLNTSVVFSRLKKQEISIAHNHKSIELKESLGLINSLDANYNNLGYSHKELGNYTIALEYLNKSIKVKEQNNKIEGLAKAYTNIGDLHFVQKNYNVALVAYKKGVIYAGKMENKLTTMELLGNLYRTNVVIGNLKDAVTFNEKYIQLRDSLDNSFKGAMRVKSKAQEEQKRFQLLEKDLAISALRVKQRDYLVISLTGSIVFILILFFILFRSTKLKQRIILAEKNANIKEQEINTLLKNQELNTVNAMLEGQEEERKRIARDLHDRLGSILAVVKLNFKSLEENIKKYKKGYLTLYTTANNLLDEACDEVRKISHDLASGILSKFGLISALNNLRNSINAAEQVEIEFLHFGLDNKRLDLALEIDVYRIIQELICNILKHAGASELNVQLLKNKIGLNIVVEDNGKGFDTEKLLNANGMGIRNINARVAKHHGQLSIDSGKGVGTTVTIDIPLKNDKND